MNYIKFLKSYIGENNTYFIYEIKLKGAYRYHYIVANGNGAVLRTYATLGNALSFVLDYCLPCD